jgi:hypothetical protein
VIGMSTPTSWLFVKDGQSVYIVRPPDSFEMMVCGPGKSGTVHEFRDEKELQDFQMHLAEELSGQGWLLWAFDRDRRSGRERRNTLRPGAAERRTIRTNTRTKAAQ